MSVSAIETSYVHLDEHVHGLLYEPASPTDRDHVLVVIMHAYADNVEHFATELASDGYRVLGTDAHASRAGTERGQFHLHDTVSDLGAAHRYARDRTDADVVVQLAHSAGPQLAALYQNVAENGVSVGQGDEKIYPLPDYLGSERLPPADGLILLDPHLGDAPKGLTDLGPQIVDEDAPRERRQAVDMLDQANGYDPEAGAPSSYGQAFLERFFDAQRARHDRLVERNLDDLRELEAGTGRFPDDDQFLLIDVGSRVYRPDPSILHRTREEWPVLHAADSSDSSRVETYERVESVRPPLANDYEPPVPFEKGAAYAVTIPTTVRKFLSTRAIRATDDYRLTEDSVEGIVWNSSNAQVPGNLQTVSAPVYLLAMTGHYFVVAAETMWEHAASTDRTLQYVHGADHMGQPLTAEYGDTRTVVYDALSDWLAERFV
jgi:hypothetical protein